MMKYKGTCFCGAIKFECEGNPYFTQYCHCNKCRDVASRSSRDEDKLGYAWTAAYARVNFKITEGEERLEELIKNNAKLLLCSSCHSLIYGISLDPDKQEGIGVNMNNIHFEVYIPQSFEPVRHIWYAERRIDFTDMLPKYKDAPQEQFGSGELDLS